MAEIKKIIRGCLKGDRRDQELLYRRYSPMLYTVALRYTCNDDDASEVLQEGFIKIFSRLSQFGNRGSFEGWMRRVVVNTALERYRGRFNLYRVDDIEAGEEPASVLFDESNPGIEVQEMLEMIRELPPKYRLVFNLYAIEGYSHKEIAERLAISEGTSKSNLSRARAILQRRVELYMGVVPKSVADVR